MDVYLNGEFLPLEQARISPLDRGFLFGDGVYEVIPIFNRIPFLLQEHLERLNRSLNAINLKNPLTNDELIAILEKLSQAAADPSHGLYLQITRGADVVRQHPYPPDLKPTVFAMISKIRPLTDEDKQKGLAAITTADERWRNCYIKSINLLPNILASEKSYLQKASEAILIHDGFVTEGASSNVFIVKNGVLLTPPQNAHILWGITRTFILQLAKKHHIPCEERPISETELFEADEVWMSNSTRRIMAITRLNNKPVGSGSVGPVWQKMDAYFEQAIKK